MADNRTALFVRLPRHQAAALDRLADATGRQKQHLVSELLGERLDTVARPLALGRLEITNTRDLPPDDVLTLEDVAALFKLPLDTVRSRAEQGDLPGRRFGKEWRFARSAVLTWLADGEPQRGQGMNVNSGSGHERDAGINQQ
jgi:excisionase family DNA binding protein